jgi:tetratricopeptide (TPR) repeat protein
LLEQAAPELTGPHQGTWFERLRADQDDLRAALAWALDTGAGDLALRMAGVLWRVWAWYGEVSEGRQWLEAALALAPHAPAPARALAWYGLGRLAIFQGDYTAAEGFLTQSLTLYRELTDAAGLAWTLNCLGDIALWRGDRAQAVTVISEALMLHRADTNPLGIARSLHSLGQLAQEAGEYTQARAFYEESLALRRELGSSEGIALSLSVLGDLLRQQGDDAQATRLYSESLALYRVLDQRMGVAATLQNLGYLALRREQIGPAERFFQESLALLGEQNEPQLVLSGLAGLGGVWAAQGQAAPATQLLGAVARGLADRELRLETVDQAEYTGYLTATRAALPEADWAGAWAAGEVLSLEEAFSLVARQADAPPAGQA